MNTKTSLSSQPFRIRTILAALTLYAQGWAGAANVTEVEPNNTIATAQNVDGSFTSNSDPDTANSTTVPHVTVIGTGNNSVDIYRFTVPAANTTCVFDIDYGMPSFDSMLRVMNGSGTVLVNVDDADTGQGAGGSSHQYDAYVALIIATPGTYYVEVSKYPQNATIPTGSSYRLQISVPGLVAPAVTTLAPTAITVNSATLRGTVNPNGLVTTAFFEYGLTTVLGSTASVSLSPNNGTTAQSVSATISGLLTDTQYYYKLTATSSQGTVSTTTGTFATLALPSPTVTLTAPTDLAPTYVTLNGTVNPQGYATTGQFQFGLTTAYGSTFPVTLSPNNGTGAQSVSAAPSALLPATTYHYRLSATNGNGTASSSDATVRTPEPAGLAAATGWPVTNVNTGTDSGRAVAVDASGNVAVTGYVADNSGDYFTAKYSPGGTLIWSKTYNNTTHNGQDQAQGVACDASGNVIVTGYSYRGDAGSGGTEIDIYTVKYAAADGTVLWSRHYNNAATNSDDRGYRVLVDASGDVIVNGYSFSNGVTGNQDYYTAKYAGSNGAVLWEARYEGPVAKTDIPGAMALDAAGNVIITGYSSGSSGTLDILTLKYASSNGAVLWQRRHAGAGNGDDYGNAITLDSAGNAIVAGLVSNGSNDDFYTAKYAAATGAVIWEKTYAGPADGSDYANSVAVDNADNVIVTGPSAGTGSGNDYYTVKYAAADGTQLWEHRYNGAANGPDEAYSIAVNSSGHAVVFGGSSNGINTDYLTCTYHGTTGVMLSSVRTDGAANQNELPGGSKAMVLMPTGYPLVTGSTQTSVGGTYDIFTVLYAGPPVVVTQSATSVGTFTAMLNGTANPVGLTTTAWFEYGATTSYGTSTTAQSIGSSTSAAPQTANLSGLVDGTLYHYRIVAQNAGGTSYGADMTFTTLIDPEIVVEQPTGTNLVDGTASIGYGDVLLGGNSAKTFTIRNTGTTPLRNLAITKDGTNAADFTVSAVSTPLAAGANTTFTVTFAPGALGARAAAVHIASNDVDENPFDIALTGTGVTPEIAVEQPAGTNLVDGSASIGYGALAIGTSSAKTFTIKNTGTAPLMGIAITVDGTHSSNYVVSTNGMSTTVAIGGSTTFTMTFTPTGTVSSTRTAALHVASSDLDENPFDIALTGDAYSTIADVDADGLNDWAEFQYSSLGFNWQVSQPALVSTLNSGANAAGLYTPAQVQALNVGVPLLQKNPTTGIFTLTVGVEKSTNLNTFNPFPMSAPQTVINGQGKLEFQFTVPDNAAFFKVLAQ